MANALNSSGRGKTTCFTCDTEILGVKISLSNSVTTHSNTSIPVKISELMGEDFLVILTGEDYICKRCNVLFNLMDRLQSELSIVQNALLGHISSKYNLPGMSNPNTMGEIQFSVNGVPYNEFAKLNNIESSQLKLQVNPPLTTKLQSPPKPKPKPNNSASNTTSKTTKMYKCGFCDFQSKELMTVKEHMRGHMNIDQKKAEKRLGSPIPPRPIKRKLFRCQVCSESYFDRKSCLSHIKATHTGENSLAQKTSVSLNNSSNNRVPGSFSAVAVNGNRVTTEKTSDPSQDTQVTQEAIPTAEIESQNTSQGTQEAIPTAETESQNTSQETQEATSTTEVASQDTAPEVENPIPELSLQSTAEQEAVVNSNDIQENGTSLEGVLRLEETGEKHTAKIVVDGESGLDIDAMLAALHSDGNNTNAVPVKIEPES
nr:PREDICTED: uncharacterized protein LOC109029859 [Bemisia tabaci]